MNCEELLQGLSAYIDGAELTDLCQEFAEHLAACQPCQVVVDNIQQTITLYRAGEPQPMPQAFTDRLQSLLQARWQEKFGPSNGTSSAR